ncbi:ribosome small subunit-dependent GTPase A [Paenibacillus senegalensis]|uniref:ribosome small subunit-dependent GTPase A n=1 Tax=Paenibacillus senegalensis TaxID=1465766 RepID=UPI000287C8C1|nr:ribosome small subunit-dependent GTPase A [Paenibacillus senegalensis]
MSQGTIVKALSGYYYVLPDGQGPGDPRIQCRGRGIFKKKKITPLVGDRVEFALTENGEGTVTEILPRSSELIRPPVANVELAVLVFSIAEPSLNLQLLDKFLVHAEHAGLDALLVLSKHDLLLSGHVDVELEEVEAIRTMYEAIGYRVVISSSSESRGLDEIREYLKGRISVFAGQSGVGKSSLLNAIIPGLSLDTNEISQKLGRGKHTTRHVELIALEPSGWVADTPGFSQLDFSPIEAEDLAACFPEMASRAPGCRFRGCLHLNEPGCSVQEAVDAGVIPATRYEHYQLFLAEIKERKRRY